MNKKKVLNLLLVTFVILCFAVFGLTWVWAHGEETNIIPESLNVKAGSQLKVTVNGLVGTKTATFTLTGMFGKFELGEFQIESDDFSQVLDIPSDVPPGPPGSYRLTVEGGEKSAKVVININ
jgi:hypothetical protein